MRTSRHGVENALHAQRSGRLFAVRRLHSQADSHAQRRGERKDSGHNDVGPARDLCLQPQADTLLLSKALRKQCLARLAELERLPTVRASTLRFRGHTSSNTHLLA